MGISPEQWDEVKELYGAALECPPGERSALLQRKAADEIVRSEVQRLLAEHDRLGSFLSTPPFIDPRLNSTVSIKRLAPGEVLSGRFRIINFIAAGGMGEVYKAEDLRLERIVVLKFLPEELAKDPHSLERFRREAKAASALNHPSICTVHDFGEDAGRAFIAMEYLEGETLAARIKRGPLSLEEVFKIAMPVAVALGTAHRKGIIHRDLKPGNIMLTESGAKLLDFGLARYASQNATDDEAGAPALSGETQVAGTLPYMSPERLRGGGTGSRGDIFAFGAVLYEMLAGRRAFEGQTNLETIAAVEHEEPRHLREFRKNVPDDLEHVIRRCLRKRPEERYASMSEIEHELEDCALSSGAASGINPRAFFLRAKRPRAAVTLLIILLMIGSAVAWWIHHSYKLQWARDHAVPQIAQLIGDGKISEAYALAVQAEPYIPHDPMFVKFWPDISWTASITTTPSGAAVYRRNYNASGEPWELVGRSPINGRRFPQTDSEWKFELEGFSTVERATFPGDDISVTMDEIGRAPNGMVRVEPAASASETTPVALSGLAGFETVPPVSLSNFWIDRFEVTNAEFKRFVDQGGYEKQDYWKHEFRDDSRVLSWTEAMALFRDKTGKPGPGTWSDGQFPAGQENYPVAGVSWFEATAYAEFVGKSLPTIFHWKAAVSPNDGPSLIPASNFGGKGLAAAGTYRGMSWCGAYDVAGNVKEWISNETGSGKRFILGGAWNEPSYSFYDPNTPSPFQRLANFGFRCAKYALNGDETKASAPIIKQPRNYAAEKPVSDQLFQVYKSLYSYDKTPLRAVVESSRQTEDWTEEKVTFDAAYGNERVIAYLFLPKKASPPYQTIVHFPGAGALHEHSSDNLLDGFLEDFDFIIKSGRAVIFPVYKGTFDRWDDFNSWPKDSIFYRDHVIYWAKDLGRSIDYLETRPDIDHTKLAYEGVSWGAAMGALVPAVEDRLKVLVLVSPGFFLNLHKPEADQINFAPRVTAPVLMLNGRFDSYFPVGSSQEPMFRLLGTPAANKRRVVYDTGHDLPRKDEIKETLNWLDRYLGPVK